MLSLLLIIVLSLPEEDIANMVLRNIDKLPHKRVAVCEFTSITGDTLEEGKLLQARVITLLTKVEGLTVIERTRLKEVLDEQKFMLYTAVDESTAFEVGKILNVDALIMGDIAILEDRKEISARLVNVLNGEIIDAVTCVENREESIKPSPEATREVASLVELRRTNPEEFTKVRNSVALLRQLELRDPLMFLIVTEQDLPVPHPLILRIHRKFKEDLKTHPKLLELIKKRRENLLRKPKLREVYKLLHELLAIRRERPAIFRAIITHDEKFLEKYAKRHPQDRERMKRLVKFVDELRVRHSKLIEILCRPEPRPKPPLRYKPGKPRKR